MLTKCIATHYRKRLPAVARHFSAQKKAGLLLVQGQGLFGALGQVSGLKDAETFQLVPPFEAVGDSSAKIIAAGWGHSAVVNQTGQLYVFGRPYDFTILMRIHKLYKLSTVFARWIAASSNYLFGNVKGYFQTPELTATDGAVTEVSASAGLTAFITNNGSVYCFGQNRWDQCGIKTKDAIHQYTPVKVPGVPACVSLETGLQHCVALTAQGQVYTWGKSNKGQVGTVSAESSRQLPATAAPQQVTLGTSAQEGLVAVQVSAGFAHSAALMSDGSLYLWGKGMSTQLKSDADKSVVAGSLSVCADQILPRRVRLPGKRLCVQIASSNFNLVMRAEDGSLWALGMGEHDRNANPLPLPVQTDYHPVLTAEEAVQAAELGLTSAVLDETDGKYYVRLPTMSIAEQQNSSHNSNTGTKSWKKGRLGQSSNSSQTAHATTNSNSTSQGPPPTLLLRGHHRVAVITNESAIDVAAVTQDIEQRRALAGPDDLVRGTTTINRASFPTQGIYEVVVHKGEAYLIEAAMPMQAGQGPYRLLDLSVGWQHKMMLVEELN